MFFLKDCGAQSGFLKESLGDFRVFIPGNSHKFPGAVPILNEPLFFLRTSITAIISNFCARFPWDNKGIDLFLI